MVWRGHDGNDDDIFLYDGNNTTNISNNSYYDYYPQISGSNVVWICHDGDDGEVFVYDGALTWQLTENNGNDYNPMISGSNVVWWGTEGPGGFGAPSVYQATWVPEPATLALLLVGGLALLRNRKRTLS